MLMLVIKSMTNNTMYAVQELYTFSQSFTVISFPSMFSLHSSTK